MKIAISKSIVEKCPQLELKIITCKVKNSASSDLLWLELDNEIEEFKKKYAISDISKRPAIAATRLVYKVLGKDPNRYRPSSEALCRRILREIPIYKVSTLVDIINFVSIRSGFSIGGFDLDKIQGNIDLKIGKADDEFEAIGRGPLNVEGLPLYCDNVGGIGTPTSDNERTKITENTINILLIINGYGGNDALNATVEFTEKLLSKYAQLKNWNVITQSSIVESVH